MSILNLGWLRDLLKHLNEVHVDVRVGLDQVLELLNDGQVD